MSTSDLFALSIKELRNVTILNKTDYINLVNQLTNENIDPESIKDDDFNERLNLIKSNQNHFVYLMFFKDALIGTTSVLIEPKFIHGMGSIAHIEDVVLDSKYHGKGYGQTLLQHAINQIIKSPLNPYKVILNCNDRMRPYYEKIGFEYKNNQMAMYF